jgi:hypothetical protein
MGLGSGIQKKPIPDPGSGSKGKKGTGSRFRIRNTGRWNALPISPRLTMGGGYSPGRTSAIGQRTRPNGTPVCFLMSGLSGMVYIVDRMNRGPKTEPNKSILIM